MIYHGGTESTESLIGFTEGVMLYEKELTVQIIGAAIEAHCEDGAIDQENLCALCVSVVLTWRR